MVLLVLAGSLWATQVWAQRTVPLHRLWTPPQVHVHFNGYVLSFRIKDINRSMELLLETGDSTLGPTSGLDTAATYHIELYARRQQYTNKLQPLMQNMIGTFLLTAGQAEVRHGRKKLSDIIMDIQAASYDDNHTYIRFYDPQNHQLIFAGSMAADMYRRDLGLDY